MEAEYNKFDEKICFLCHKPMFSAYRKQNVKQNQ